MKPLSHYGKKLALLSSRKLSYTNMLITKSGRESNVAIYSQVKILSHQGRLNEALIVLHRMDCQGMFIDSGTYISLLQCCINERALPQGKLLHAHIIQSGFEFHDTLIENKVITMYAMLETVEDAQKILNQVKQDNLISWNVMISAFCKQGHALKALRLFYHIIRLGIKPDQFTFSSVIPACTNLEALKHGKEVHEKVIKCGFQSNVFVGSALVDMYVKCGSLEDARKLFDRMPERNVVSWTAMVAGYSQSGDLHEALMLFEQMPQRNALSWNAMIVGYAQKGLVEEAMDLFWRMPKKDVVSWTAMIGGCAHNGYNDEALGLFLEMIQFGMKPNQVTFACVLPACASLGRMDYAKEIHGKVIQHGFESNVFVASAIVHMYVKGASTECARKVLDKMTERDVVAWTAMITGYAQTGHLDEALKLFQAMTERNVVTWNAMIAGYAQTGCMDEAMELFQSMPKPDLFSWTALVQGYAQQGYVIKALHLFEKMPERDVASWTAMIVGYAQNGLVDEARKLFGKMPERDVASWNAMIAGYFQNWHPEEGLKLFLKMPERDFVSWSVMIVGFVQNGYFEESIKLFRESRLTGVKPNPGILASVLASCASLAGLSHGKEAHEDSIRNGFHSDVSVGNALIEMYAKCGNINDAHKIFHKMHMKNVVSWTAMIVGYAMHGCGKQALQLFEQMQHSGIKPNHITFVGVLSACCHAGLVDDGLQYFNSMSRHYYITPAKKHYGCLVDLLARAGLLYEAYNLINTMPINADATIWISLLGACRNHGNIDLGERVAQCILELDPMNSATYVLLANIYAAAGRWDDMSKVRRRMKYSGVEKIPGCTWIEVNKQLYAFLVGD